jgi:hypothetical protein
MRPAARLQQGTNWFATFGKIVCIDVVKYDTICHFLEP